MDSDLYLNVLTLNCWGIPYVSKDRLARMNAIAEALVDGSYDIVCLQEVWSINDFRNIATKAQKKLPFSHYFFSGVVGSGICILSRYPIKDVMFHKWSLNGYVHKITHGDWFGGKGVGLCIVRVKDINLHVYIAHLHAEYNQDNNEYTAHRVLQAFDTAQFIRMTKGGADAIILSGDLNTEPHDLAYRIICGVAGLTDACSANLNIVGTNECAKNSYTESISARKCPEGKRIDHILYLGSNNMKMEAMNFEHPLPSRIPDSNFSYSDHEAIMASFKLVRGKDTAKIIDVKDALKEALFICESAQRNLSRHRLWYIIISCILVIPLLWSMGLDYTSTSIGMIVAINIGQLLLTAVLCYALFMSSIWNKLEKNALKACCSTMDLYLMQITGGCDRKTNVE